MSTSNYQARKIFPIPGEQNFEQLRIIYIGAKILKILGILKSKFKLKYDFKNILQKMWTKILSITVISK